ncbi:MAG: hypothetical protein HN498_04585 [Flavobacteriales bacterium]|jgi:hypothetical protein|nr:hypothetical protein [Flavobacteriales bacterium]
MNKILLTLTVIAIIFTSCEKDKPIATDITINFTHTVNGSDLITNSMIYTNAADEKYDVQTLKYLISNITLHDDLGYTVLKDIHFIEISDESTFSFTYDNVPNNNYHAISYTMGLDTVKNISNAYVNENWFGKMEWPDMIGGGYHYMKLEGDFNDSLSGYGTHTGGTMGGDYSFNNTNDISLTVNDDLGDISIDINMEINNWYQGPNEIEFSTYVNPDGSAGIMMNMEKQMQLKANGSLDVFSVTVKN